MLHTRRYAFVLLVFICLLSFAFSLYLAWLFFQVSLQALTRTIRQPQIVHTFTAAFCLVVHTVVRVCIAKNGDKTERRKNYGVHELEVNRIVNLCHRTLRTNFNIN